MSKLELKTLKHGTMTSEGYIAHKYHYTGLRMPVALDIPKNLTKAQRDFPQPPLRDREDNLVFMLPGGRKFVGGRW